MERVCVRKENETMRKQYICPLSKVEIMTAGEPIMDLAILRGSVAGNSESKTFDEPGSVF